MQNVKMIFSILWNNSVFLKIAIKLVITWRLLTEDALYRLSCAVRDSVRVSVCAFAYLWRQVRQKHTWLQRDDIPVTQPNQATALQCVLKVSFLIGRNDIWPVAENAQSGRIVLPVANLLADSESKSPSSYSRLLATICLSRLVLEIFACDVHRWSDGPMNNADRYYSCPMF